MKTFALLYSATSALDYRFIASPSKEDIPEETLKKFRKAVKGLLSNESPISTPKWLLIKEFVNGTQYVLWGMASQNSFFSKRFSLDKKIRDIQCFVGIVIGDADNNLKLSYDGNCFTSLFESVMDQHWESLDPKTARYDIELPLSDVTISPSKVSGINLDSSICRFFPGTYNSELLFSEALASITNVSIASGIYMKSEVISPEYSPLLNAILLKKIGEIKDQEVKCLCSKCNSSARSLNNGLCDDCLNSDDSSDVVTDDYDEDVKLEDEQNHDVQEHLLPICSKCMQKVEYVYGNGECEMCTKKRKWNKYLILISLIFLFLGVSKCDCSNKNLINITQIDLEFQSDSVKVDSQSVTNNHKSKYERILP